MTEYGLQLDSPTSKVRSSGQKNPTQTGSSSNFAPGLSVRSSNQSSEVFNLQRTLLPSVGTPLAADKQKRMSQRVHPHSEAEVNHVVSVLPRNTSFKHGSTQVISKDSQMNGRLVAQGDADETQVFNLKKVFLNSQASSSQLASQGQNKHPTLPKEYGSTYLQEATPKSYSIQAQIKARVEQQNYRKKQSYAKLASQDDGSSDLQSSKANWRSEFNHSLADSPKSKSKHRKASPKDFQQGYQGKSGHKLSDNSSEASPVLSSKVSPQLQSRILRPKQYQTQLTLEGQRSVRNSQKLSLWNGSASPSRTEDALCQKLPAASFQQAAQQQVWARAQVGLQEMLDGKETRRSTYQNTGNQFASKHSIPDLAQSYAETSRKHGSSSTAQESPVKQNGGTSSFTNKLSLEKLQVGYLDNNSPVSKQKSPQAPLHSLGQLAKPVDPDFERLLKAQQRLEECKRRKKDQNRSKELKPRMVGDSFEGTMGMPSLIEITASNNFSPDQSKPSRVRGSPLGGEGPHWISESQPSPNARKPKLTLLQSSQASQAKPVISRQPTMNSIDVRTSRLATAFSLKVLEEEPQAVLQQEEYQAGGMQFSLQSLRTVGKPPAETKKTTLQGLPHAMGESPSRLVRSQVPADVQKLASAHQESAGWKSSAPSDSPAKGGSPLASPQRPTKLTGSPVNSSPGYKSSKNFSITPQNLKSASFKETCGNLAPKGSNTSRGMEGGWQIVESDLPANENSARKIDNGTKGAEKTFSKYNLSQREQNTWRINGDEDGVQPEVNLYTSVNRAQEPPGHRRRVGATNYNHFS